MAARHPTKVPVPKNPRFTNLAGRKFGLWLVLSYAGYGPCGNMFWNCRCSCGMKRMVSGGALVRRATRGCRTCRTALHLMTNTPEHRAWRNMKERCTTPTHQVYRQYGKRGIKVCKRWAARFLDFFEDMGPKPSPKHSLDRIDNDGNYSCGKCKQCKKRGWPMNCRWATSVTQNRNKTDNRFIVCNGQSKTLSEWSALSGKSKQALRYRLQHMTVKDAIFGAMQVRRKRSV